MNKKIFALLGVLIIIIATIIVVLLMNNDNSENSNIENNNEKEEILSFDVEVYDKVTINDLTREDVYDFIDTEKLGKQEVEYKVNDEVKKIIVNVKDTTPPYIGLREYYNHIIDTNFTFEKDVICADNYDKNITCNIIGDYDISVLGENKLKVVATDSSNNKTEKDFILRVIEKPGKSNPNYISAADAIKNKPDNTELMIDVSKWQADIDWKKVKDSGVKYVMLRLGTQKAIDDESVIDDYFEKNIKAAHENGLKVGVYYYSYANDIDDAKIQAEWVLEQLKGYELELPVAFDWECWGFFNGFHISIHDLNEIAMTFLSTIEKEGYKVVNYGSKIYMENIWNLDNYDVWLAHYSDKTSYEGKYIMWQFTDSGLLNGVNGRVDFNYLYLFN